MSEDLIVLYDIPSAVLPDKAWSPNVWKTRLLLNYKGLPYRTEWTESPDLRPVAMKLGVPPNKITSNGNPLHFAPFIWCPRTSAYVPDSLEIAIHLEHAYPETPRVIQGPVCEALVRAWDAHWNETVSTRMYPLMLMRTHDQLTPRSAAGFRWSRERMLGTSLEAQAPPDKQPALWDALRQGLARIDGYLRDAPFVAGNQLTYPDFVIAGWLIWMKRVLGPESAEWQEVEKWNDGRWKKHLDVFSQWEYVDGTNAPTR
ncbi:hypothetical protein K488DRAFT_49127 [Vararia minispora EC-137]|uniref:Uncharacterized protein n=1 Tax=Vararia minispora EC-137 TaxID=1314806 RepID=A0ACB8QMB1_9AGAM|nr:hypothetical protein K488DRAFT_49127 [Vararia minispora EC-137]